jgi:hypothetical protein
MREDYDNAKRPCKTVDVVINPEVCENLPKEDQLMLFFIQIFFQWMLQKHKVALSDSKKFFACKNKK